MADVHEERALLDLLECTRPQTIYPVSRAQRAVSQGQAHNGQGPRSGPFRKLHTRIVPFRAGSTYLKVGWVTPGLLAMD